MVEDKKMEAREAGEAVVVGGIEHLCVVIHPKRSDYYAYAKT